MNKQHRKLPFCGAVLLCAWLAAGQARAAQSEEPSVLVSTAPVVSQTLASSLKAFGTLQADPDQVLSLSLPHAGLINRIWIRLGQRVKSGDRLLEIVTSPEARMQYLQASSAVDFAERELERQQRLYEEHLATSAQLDAAKRALQDANTTMKALAQSGQDVSEETLRSPMDGIVTQLNVSQGQRVQASTTAMLIAAEHRLIARLGVEAEDLARVGVGKPVTLSSVFDPDVRIESAIREVHAMVDPSTQLVEVLAEIPEAQSRQLVLGSRVVGLIRVTEKSALVVPRTAVLGEAGNAYIFTIAEGRAVRVPVKVGIEQDSLVEISGAINAGDPVVISGNYELEDGMAVRENP
jgi:RND family efflux transporter MFP subunit